MQNDTDFLNAWFTAFLCIAGEEGKHWAFLEIDVPELLDPQFDHQN